MEVKKFETKPSKNNFDDRIYQCVSCSDWILIPFNIVGGAWHLSGYKDKNGKLHFGTYCRECYGIIEK